LVVYLKNFCIKSDEKYKLFLEFIWNIPQFFSVPTVPEIVFNFEVTEDVLAYFLPALSSFGAGSGHLLLCGHYYEPPL